MAHLLVIEDNPTNLQLMVYLLSAFGHTVVEARDGEDGLIAAVQEAPDLIVCDVHIPKVDGYEVCRRLKSDPDHRSIPVVAVTALAMVGDRQTIMGAGFDGYIAKPIEPQSFVKQIEAFLSADALVPGRPRSSAPAGAAAGKSVRHARLRRHTGTVLVVDNSHTNRSLMRSILEPHGYRVVVAETPREALAAMEQGVPDVIVSDLHMPGQSGFSFIKEVKADPRWHAIPFIFISSTDSVREANRETALDLGATRFILRPVEPETLLAEIRACRQRRPGPG